MAREVIEVTPLVTKQTPVSPVHVNVLYSTLKVLGLISLWYFFSTLLSLLNKHVIGHEGIEGAGKFPAPLLMTGIQFFIQFLLARLFLDLGLVERLEKHEDILTWSQYFKTVVPNAVSTGLDIGFSNLSMRTISLSFYTMCKSTTPMFLLMFAFIWKLEKQAANKGNLFGIMLVISCGVLLLVYGETKFSFTGFTLVMTAACLAGLRWTLTQVLLQGHQRSRQGRSNSGPLELLEKLTPIMSGVVLLVSVCFERWHRLSQSSYFCDVERSLLTLAMIIVFGVIAFLMVWTEFNVIKETSALTFMVAGVFKEFVTIVAAIVFFDEDFGLINALGLVVVIAGVVLYNMHKYKKMEQQQHNNNHKSNRHDDRQLAEDTSEIPMQELMQLTAESHCDSESVKHV